MAYMSKSLRIASSIKPMDEKYQILYPNTNRYLAASILKTMASVNKEIFYMKRNKRFSNDIINGVYTVIDLKTNKIKSTFTI